MIFRLIGDVLYFIGVLFRSRESLERERAALRRQIEALQAQEGADRSTREGLSSGEGVLGSQE